MMQNIPPVIEVPPPDDEDLGAAETAPERMATVWLSRISGIVGGICLAMALTLWLLRPEHYRTVLGLLTIAMFAAVLHTYTFENGG